tara:strand:+ start:237 stop:1103 length:867 start_codon:yes stop_codon:yes gene_type:complete
MEKLSKLKIMISGANGFLGKNLMDHLSKTYDVRPISIRYDNLKSVGNDILEYQPDIFIYNGWYSGNAFSSVNNYEQFNNINIAIELGKVFSQLKNLYFVGVGSFAEYGVNETLISESDPECVNNYYGASKNILKLFTKTLCEFNNFKWLWLRPCYIYGPGDVQNRLIPSTIQACINNKDLTLNSCDSVVDYLYIDDFTSAVNQLLLNKNTGIFNICSGKQYKIKDIIYNIKKLSKSDIEIIFDPLKDRKNDYTKHICGSNKKLKNHTMWEPKNTLIDGLSKTIKYGKK